MTYRENEIEKGRRCAHSNNKTTTKQQPGSTEWKMKYFYEISIGTGRRQRDTHSHFVAIELRVIRLCSCQQEIRTDSIWLLLLLWRFSIAQCLGIVRKIVYALNCVSMSMTKVWRDAMMINTNLRSKFRNKKEKRKKWKIIEHQLIFCGWKWKSPHRIAFVCSEENSNSK